MFPLKKKKGAPTKAAAKKKVAAGKAAPKANGASGDDTSFAALANSTPAFGLGKQRPKY